MSMATRTYGMLSVRNTSEHSALRCRACAPSGARAGGAGLPRHVIHPRDGKPGLWDVYGRALCPYLQGALAAITEYGRHRQP